MNVDLLKSVDRIVKTDVIVVGAGLGGLTVALNLAGSKVTLITKSKLNAGAATSWAQGGIAAAIGGGDSPELHALDTMAVSGDLAAADIVKIVTQEAPAALRKVAHLGVRFDRDAKGQFVLGREAAHSRARILHARDATGSELMRALLETLHQRKQVSTFEEMMGLDLIVEKGKVIGLTALDIKQRKILYLAQAVVLATGGIGHLYLKTTNPEESTGDGLAMAARAGAMLADLAFVQFHPTALAMGTGSMPLISEALRGAGAQLVDKFGHRLLADNHEPVELLGRDQVARLIWKKLQMGEEVFLDARLALIPDAMNRFPTVFNHCKQYNIDLRYELIPVAPAAHYHMGGVWVNDCGQTSLPGLWACGEVAATGAHGANRLASNSLLEALVFGIRIVNKLIPLLSSNRLMTQAEQFVTLRTKESRVDDHAINPTVIASSRALMWNQVGIERNQHALQQAVSTLRDYEQGAKHYLRHLNLFTVSRLIAQAALLRSESRGSHYRCDYPQTDPKWRKRQVLVMNSFGAITSKLTDIQNTVPLA